MLRAILAAALLALASAAPASDLRIALVSARSVFYVPVWLAHQKGFLKEEGIDATIVPVSSAQKINEELRSGRAHVSISSPESVIVDAYRGGTLRIIAGNAERLPHFIIARPHIKTLQGLRGARFGVMTLNEGTTQLVHQLARQVGLMPTDYQVLPVGGPPTRWKLLQEGKIDAALQPIPQSYEAQESGFSNLGPISRFIPEYLFTSVNVDARWASRNRETASAFLRALKRGQMQMGMNPREAAAVVARELNTTAEFAERALQDMVALKILSEDLSVSEPALAATFESVKSVGLLPPESSFDPTRMVDSSYVK
jgi:ABC-type nitrate/sulfonate/bicarbonate transport system substrate-binding protein